MQTLPSTFTSFLMVKMASSMDHGRVRLATTNDDGHIASGQLLEWTAKYKEVDAGKEFKRTLKDRLEGNDMWKSQGIK